MSKILFKDDDGFECYDRLIDDLEDLGNKLPYSSYIFESIIGSNKDKLGYQRIEILTDFEFYLGKTLHIEVDNNNDFIVTTDYEEKSYTMKIRGNNQGMDIIIDNWSEAFKESHKIGKEVLKVTQKL